MKRLAASNRIHPSGTRYTVRATIMDKIGLQPCTTLHGPDLQNILRQSYEKLRSTYDRRLIYKTSYDGRKAFLQGCSGAGTRRDGVPPTFFDRRTRPQLPHFFGLKSVQKLVHCCNWLLTETQCKIISVQQN